MTVDLSAVTYSKLWTRFVLLALAGAAPSVANSAPNSRTVVWPQGQVLISDARKPEYRELSPAVSVSLAPGTRVVRRGPIRVNPGSGESTHAFSLQLLQGRLEIHVDKSKEGSRPVVVQAPRSVTAVVREGDSIITAGSHGVAVAAVRGLAIAARNNSWRTVNEGSLRAFTPEHPQGSVSPVLGIAQPTVDSQLALLLPGANNTDVHASWTPVPGATSYDVRLHRRDPSRTYLEHRIEASDTQARFDHLVPGTYEVAVRALDPYNVGGPRSVPVPLRVVAVRLPKGAQVQHGVVFLGRQQRVSFSHAAGLELSYDQATQFVPLPDSVGLRNGKAVVLRLRDPGQTGEATLSLVPQTIEADVELTPRTARWPQDQVTTRIRLRGYPGSASDALSSRTEVTVNGRLIVPQWSRKANLLEAIVPPPRSPGPWVVRVKVFDRFGELVGRDFLEVAN